MIRDSEADEVDVVVPDDLAGALRRAAAAVPAADLHPSEPKLRYAARRRRRRTVAACLTSAAVLVTAMLAAKVLDRSPDGSNVAMADRSQTTEGDGTSGDGALEGPHAPLLMPLVNAELQPDGTIRQLPLAQPQDAPTGGAVRLPDGRLVTLATRDLRPGVPRVDGALVEGLAYVLAVFDGDGKLLAEQDIRRMGERVSIAGTRDGKVVLVRATADGNCCGSLPGVRVSTIDPDTFVETPAAEVDGLPGVAAVAADRLVLVDDGTMGATDEGDGDGNGLTDVTDARVPECRITVVDLDTGESDALTTMPCLSVGAVSVSPDGARAAVVMQRRAGITASGGGDVLDQAVVFLSLDDGAALGSERFDVAPACPRSGSRDCTMPRGPVEYRGLAWVDDDHVELVVQRPDPDPSSGQLEAGAFAPERLRVVPVEVGTG